MGKNNNGKGKRRTVVICVMTGLFLLFVIAGFFITEALYQP